MAVQGLKRSTATIRNWLNNPNLIGPRNLEDIEKIACVAENSELLLNISNVIKSIKIIRNTHISAGNIVTKLILEELHQQLSHPGDQPMLLDLDYGKVWIVQVEEIDSKAKAYPKSHINRLLWDD